LNKPHVITNAARLRQSALSVLLGATLAASALYYYDRAMRPIHVTVSRTIYNLAERVCLRNDGWFEIVIERSNPDVFTFRCHDGMSLKDTVVRLK